MALCKKCQKREQHTFPNGRTVAMCAVCGLELLYALFDEPEESGLTSVAADCCQQCGADSWRDAINPDTLEICNVCGNSR